jgi:aldehyde:ferredoxin oxidoreductase
VNDLRMLIVNLERRTAEALPPDEALRKESLGGAAVNLALIERHGRDAVVFGAGPLTGTLAPASALLVGSFVTGPSIHHVPLLLTAGPDFRFSGIDHLVLTGKADRPTLLHLDNGRVRFLDPPAEKADGCPPMTLLRRSAPPFRSAIWTGAAAAAGVPFAALSLDAKGSLDKANLAGAMAAKNLGGLLLGGSGGTAFAAEDLVHSLEIAGKIKKLRKKAGGFEALVKAAGNGDCLKSLKGAKLQEAACFHCPAPCMAHARFAWTDPRQPQKTRQEAGVLLMDPLGWTALAQKRGEGALPLLKESVRLGLDPCAVAALLPAEGTLSSDLDLLAGLARGAGSSPSPSASPAAAGDTTFGDGLPQIGTGEEARRLTALAFTLGICPLFLQRFPEAAGDLAAFHPDTPPASLDRTADAILTQR